MGENFGTNNLMRNLGSCKIKVKVKKVQTKGRREDDRQGQRLEVYVESRQVESTGGGHSLPEVIS